MTMRCAHAGRFELFNQKDCIAHDSNSGGFAVIDLTDQPSAVVRFKEPAS